MSRSTEPTTAGGLDVLTHPPLYGLDDFSSLSVTQTVAVAWRTLALNGLAQIHHYH